MNPSAPVSGGIHPSAIVDPAAKIGARSTIQSHVVIEGDVIIGENTFIGHGAIIGTPPQDLSFSPQTKSGVVIGNNNVIRELCTIHRGATEGSTFPPQLYDRKQGNHREQLFARRTRARGRPGIHRRRFDFPSAHARRPAGDDPG